jgi:hypothetical protein
MYQSKEFAGADCGDVAMQRVYARRSFEVEGKGRNAGGKRVECEFHEAC